MKRRMQSVPATIEKFAPAGRSDGSTSGILISRSSALASGTLENEWM